MTYITKKDVDKKISNCRERIECLEKQLKLEKEKLDNYTILQDYLIRGGICPYSKKRLFGNYERFKFYILPLKQRHSLSELREDLKIVEGNVEDLVQEAVFSCDAEPRNYKEVPHSNLDEREKSKYLGINAGKLLEDFIQFVCAYKGHRIGVGQFLINKYINELYKD